MSSHENQDNLPATTPPTKGVAVQDINSFAVTFTPVGAVEPMTLRYPVVAAHFGTPTASNAKPTAIDICKFMQLCKAAGLNPYVGDAFLVGYDSKNGPMFNLIVSVLALRKRATLSAAFAGIQSGVIVLDSKGREHVREGAYYAPDETLVGAWSKVHRKDHAIPHFKSVRRSAYDSGRSRWATDPGGMLVKCAESAAFREAFPLELGALYTQEEMDIVHYSVEKMPAYTSLQDLTKKLGTPLIEATADGNVVVEVEESAAQDEQSSDIPVGE